MATLKMDYDLADCSNLAADATAYIKKKEGRFFKAGGLWIYDNEIENVTGEFENGDIISVRDFDKFFLGYGVISLSSTIRIRMLSKRENEPVSYALLASRVKDAWEYRKKVIDTSSCRVIFGEADFLPGLRSINTMTFSSSNRCVWEQTD